MNSGIVKYNLVLKQSKELKKLYIKQVIYYIKKPLTLIHYVFITLSVKINLVFKNHIVLKHFLFITSCCILGIGFKNINETFFLLKNKEEFYRL